MKIIPCAFVMLMYLSAFSQSTEIKYLSGTDKDHTVSWDFYCTNGRSSGRWTKISVPSCWEQQGFGNYNYGHDKIKYDEQGLYRHQFFAEASWQGQNVFLVFEGSMTDTEVKINGTLAGPPHQGSFYRFKYDVTNLIKLNQQNLLEITVSKMSANASVNNAERGNSDFWLFGGIFRPVYLEIVPETFIERTALDAGSDGLFTIDIYLKNAKGNEVIEATVMNKDGVLLDRTFAAKVEPGMHQVELRNNFTNPLLWSAEFPDLYTVMVTLKDKTKIIHQVKEKFGFRTIDLRKNDGLYINGAKIVLKGSNRHSFWPETGRTLSHTIHVMDAKLMKEMNMNAVRMSHYPPDKDFLDVCDSIGLYVLDELTGWQAKYDTLVGHKLVKELVLRDVNHPSIIFWDNGNEGGWNTALDNDYALYDPQKRTVLHPWGKFNGTDTKHYPDYNYVINSVSTGQEVFFPTEFMHGLYDGGAGAALDDFWKQMMKHPHNAGGFIWAFVDEAVIRYDKNGIYDSDGNHGADGILGPHREKEASFYSIKEIWSPIYVNTQPIDEAFTGQVQIENRYAFTALSKCKFKWELRTFPSPQKESTKATSVTAGIPLPLELAPGEKGMLNLNLPSSWRNNDVLYLTAYGPYNEELFSWSWAIKPPSAFIAKSKISQKFPLAIKDDVGGLLVKNDGLTYYFNTATGYIVKVMKGQTLISLSGGPDLAGINTTLKEFTYSCINKKCTVLADYVGADSLHVEWTFTSGSAVKLSYRYTQHHDADFMGITFNYPEDKITGVRYLGRGPYRAWKNRLKGQEFGVWRKSYNNTVTGENWEYPEFKGYHAEVNWVVIDSKEAPFTVYTDTKNMFLQILHPQREKDALKTNYVEPSFPIGDIGFLNGVSPIGTKFQDAKVLGPQGQKNIATEAWINGTLWFDFTDRQ